MSEDLVERLKFAASWSETEIDIAPPDLLKRAAEEIETIRAKLASARKALEATRSLVSEGAMEGFNPLAGDWAERLFRNQADISAALKDST